MNKNYCLKQRKKITSIANIDCKEGRLRFGTIDKKNPSVMFIEGGFYIMPLIKKQDYKTDIDNVRKQLKNIIKQNLENNQYFRPEHMFFTDVAEDRIMSDKKTYFSFQIYLMPKEELISNCNFKELLPKINDKNIWLKLVENEMIKNNYSVSKTKKSQ